MAKASQPGRGMQHTESELRTDKEIIEEPMKYTLLGIALVLVAANAMLAEKAQQLSVRVVNRQNYDTGYSYVVPSHSSSTSNADVNCYGDSTNVNCHGSSTTTGYTTEPREISYSVTGATFTLLLPDGRMAVVNCVSKYKPKGDYVNRRSCRIPLVDNIEAEFKGKNAKLEWPVSLDGKKMESETYKILAVFPRSS